MEALKQTSTRFDEAGEALKNFKPFNQNLYILHSIFSAGAFPVAGGAATNQKQLPWDVATNHDFPD